MPPDVREWLPARHLAWFVLDAVAATDLAAFYAAYREDPEDVPTARRTSALHLQVIGLWPSAPGWIRTTDLRIRSVDR
jgi:hypothetical protein